MSHMHVDVQKHKQCIAYIIKTKHTVETRPLNYSIGSNFQQ